LFPDSFLVIFLKNLWEKTDLGEIEQGRSGVTFGKNKKRGGYGPGRNN